ncbi:MAG: hypothetical protein HY738_03640 [Bacteroidia bacterium]|nr:hypothetical protein [Bacteroidia bacterium]
MNDEFIEKEKIELENLLMKSQIILNQGEYHEVSKVDPEIKNQFLKNIMAIENVERKPGCEILGVNPNDFPLADKLTKDELASKFGLLVDLLAEHSYFCDFSEKIPLADAYNYLVTDFLKSVNDILPEGWTTHLDGCGGDCPGCFQVEYCNNKNDVWEPEELETERKRRAEEN